MQPLTAAPREHLTEEQVRDLITGDEVTVSSGLELLDSQNRFIEDISDDMVGGTVGHEGRGTVHGTCSLQIQRPLAWGRDRVRVYRTLSNGAVTARFNRGVYVLTTPKDQRGETPQTFDVQGYDLLQPLLDPVGDTYVVMPEAGVDLVTNSGFEGGITGWESNPAFGAMTPATLASSTLHASAGTGSLEITWPTASRSWANTHSGDFVVGKTYLFEADVWVPLDGPSFFRFEVIFLAGSPWMAPTKGAMNHFEWLWTATKSDVFIGLTAQDPVAGTKTWIDGFHATGQSTTCLDAVRTVIEFAGGGAPFSVDGTQQVAVLPGPMVWGLTESQPTTWLDICNDLLDAIGYGALWVDQDGTYRSEPFVPPEQRPVSWTFDLADERTNLVGGDRTSEQDVWDAPNRWTFVRRGMAVQPVEGDGIYTVNNLARGPASQASLGKVRRKTVYLDAVDQAALVARGDRVVAEDTAATRTVTLSVDPLPIAGHLDVVRYVDGDDAAVAEVVSWEEPLDGSQGRWVLEVVL
ncbi:hypothetical protein [Nocardioides sp. T2.26MG-1]|uniref:hypothetical protein n=1 Tax=Nocardioides sp. T2.26MG-1 TaxID=3041166 RepID=UPI002477A677|nr:hypothetical protein [Nocardioides sp. T2.26MG-1]CAI9417396.1 hypothetical protein HIDPHFAB_03009 [Nocardioides sp. T2.26MG-1]